MKKPVLILLAAATLMAAGCSMPSERSVYAEARRAVKAHADLPPSAVLGPRRDVEMGICKNAARVDFPFEYISDSGERVTDGYVVWLKRIARTWVVDRCYPTPKYPRTEPSS